MDVGDKSNSYSSCTVHVEIQEYKVQNIRINPLKTNLRKRKTSVWYKNILNERILTDLKKRLQFLYMGQFRHIINKMKKEDTSMTSFPKTEYWRHLVTNA